jgi:hypothetical protein
MKSSIVSSVLFLLLGIGLCSNAAAKSKYHNTKPGEEVSLIPLHYNRGFAVMVDKQEPGKSMVIVYDAYGTPVFKDMLTSEKRAEKKYLLSDLSDGIYSVEVYSKGHDVKTNFYIYNNGRKRVVDIM